MQPMLSDTFAEKRVPMEMIGAKMEELYFLHGPCRNVISDTSDFDFELSQLIVSR
jgi:hypothetical protein